MQIAVNKEGERISIYDAIRGEEYFCPICNGELSMKKGVVNIHHFAHKSLSDCDDWARNNIGPWHLEWQNQFPKESREVVIDFEGIKHRADIKLDGVVIEFQYSNLSITEMEKRIKFYTREDDKVIFLYNLIGNGNIFPSKSENIGLDHLHRYQWKSAKRSIKVPDNMRYFLFFQIEDNLILPVANTDELCEVDKTRSFKNFYTYNPLTKKEFLDAVMSIPAKKHLFNAMFYLKESIESEVYRIKIMEIEEEDHKEELRIIDKNNKKEILKIKQESDKKTNEIQEKHEEEIFKLIEKHEEEKIKIINYYTNQIERLDNFVHENKGDCYMRKPKDFNSTSVNSFTVLPAGGYICKITGIDERESSKGSDMVVVHVDILEGEYAGYFTEIHKNDTRENKKWPHGATSYIVLEFADGRTNPNFKKFITYCEESNNFKVDWDGEYSQLVGKQIGVTFGREEYEGTNGRAFSTKVFYFNTIEQIRKGVKVPDDKLLDGNSSSKKVQEDDGDDMPF